MSNIVYFDLETQKSADEVGGWNNIRDMRMSVGVTYSTARGAYQIYGENQVNALMGELRRADLVVGFNNLRFDYQVLAGYNPLFDAGQIRTLDLLVELQRIPSTGCPSTRLPKARWGWKRPATVCKPLSGTERANCWRSPNTAATT